jgi:hypothetical protein
MSRRSVTAWYPTPCKPRRAQLVPDPFDLQIADARSEIRQVRDWLTRPNTATLTACEPALERVVGSIQDLSLRLKTACVDRSPHCASAAMELADEIHEVQTLLSAAARLYYGRVHKLSPTS